MYAQREIRRDNVIPRREEHGVDGSMEEPAGKRPGEGPGGEEILRVRLPQKGNREMFGATDLMMGASHIRVRCFDGVTRLGRIKGKIKKKVWIREGDILIIMPWSFQDEKCDIIYVHRPPGRVAEAEQVSVRQTFFSGLRRHRCPVPMASGTDPSPPGGPAIWQEKEKNGRRPDQSVSTTISYSLMTILLIFVGVVHLTGLGKLLGQLMFRPFGSAR
jgi:translation initiation factor 1A